MNKIGQQAEKDFHEYVIYINNLVTIEKLKISYATADKIKGSWRKKLPATPDDWKFVEDKTKLFISIRKCEVLGSQYLNALATLIAEYLHGYYARVTSESILEKAKKGLMDLFYNDFNYVRCVLLTEYTEQQEKNKKQRFAVSKFVKRVK